MKELFEDMLPSEEVNDPSGIITMLALADVESDLAEIDQINTAVDCATDVIASLEGLSDKAVALKEDGGLNEQGADILLTAARAQLSILGMEGAPSVELENFADGADRIGSTEYVTEGLKLNAAKVWAKIERVIQKLIKRIVEFFANTKRAAGGLKDKANTLSNHAKDKKGAMREMEIQLTGPTRHALTVDGKDVAVDKVTTNLTDVLNSTAKGGLGEQYVDALTEVLKAIKLEDGKLVGSEAEIPFATITDAAKSLGLKEYTGNSKQLPVVPGKSAVFVTEQLTGGKVIAIVVRYRGDKETRIVSTISSKAVDLSKTMIEGMAPGLNQKGVESLVTSIKQIAEAVENSKAGEESAKKAVSEMQKEGKRVAGDLKKVKDDANANKYAPSIQSLGLAASVAFEPNFTAQRLAIGTAKAMLTYGSESLKNIGAEKK